MRDVKLASVEPIKDYHFPSNQGSPLKTHIYPVGENSVLLRVANLDDVFDNKDWLPNVMNLTQFAINFYKEANMYFGQGPLDIDPKKFRITETTLTGVQEYERGTNEFKQFEWNHEPEITLKM